jgi:hypothetical protein
MAKKYNHEQILSLLDEGLTFDEVAAKVGCSKSTAGNILKASGKSRQARHGYKNTRTYRIWIGMKNRCLNQSSKDYYKYGGRGITVCKRWRDSFLNFLEDMGETPENMSLDRKDFNGNYEPSNCQWATIQVQNTNRRGIKFIEYRGESKTLAQWCRDLGLDYHVTWNRLYRDCKSVQEVFGND